MRTLKSRMYLDHAATTPISQVARSAMLPWIEGNFGNPSSTHSEGRAARAAIDFARETLSEKLGCLFGEAMFTGSGTEAANLAIIGTALAAIRDKSHRKRILFGAAEHHCVLHTRSTLEILGFEVETIRVDNSAQIDLDHLQSLLTDDVLMVSVMHANNELGTINPIKEVAKLAQKYGTLIHCDAVQTFGQLDCNVSSLEVDFLTVSGHKIYAPKGVGAIYIRAGIKPVAIIIGGGQEREMRAGTENVSNIVGFGAAIRDIQAQTPNARNAFESVIQDSLGDSVSWSVSPGVERLNGHSHFRLIGAPNDSGLIRLDRAGIAAGGGAACSSGSQEPSHVLIATGLSETEASEGLRFTFGRNQGENIGNEAGLTVVETLKEIAMQHDRH